MSGLVVACMHHKNDVLFISYHVTREEEDGFAKYGDLKRFGRGHKSQHSSITTITMSIVWEYYAHTWKD